MESNIYNYEVIKAMMKSPKKDLLSSSISACCKHKQKSAYGFKWLYYEEWEKIENFIGKEVLK